MCTAELKQHPLWWSLAHFINGMFIFSLLSLESSLHVLNTRLLSDMGLQVSSSSFSGSLVAQMFRNKILKRNTNFWSFWKSYSDKFPRWVVSLGVEHIWAFSFKYRASCVCVQVSHVQLLAAPRTVVWQAPLSMEFSRQEYWSGLQHSLPGDLPKPRDYTSISYVSCLGRWIHYHQHHLGNPSRLQCQVTS